jgi:hypothetical protein
MISGPFTIQVVLDASISSTFVDNCLDDIEVETIIETFEVRLCFLSRVRKALEPKSMV